MNKRKSQASEGEDSSEREGECAKQARVEGEADAAASSCATSSFSSSSSSSSLSPSPTATIDDELIPLHVKNTRKLIDVLQLPISLLERVKTACELIQAATAGDECQLDMSMRTSLSLGSKSARTLLLRLMWECLPDSNDRAAVALRRTEAYELLKAGALPHFLELLTLNPQGVDEITGDNALHELLLYVHPMWDGCWSAELIKEMVKRGVSVHARNKRDRTPMLVMTSQDTDSPHAAHWIRLLLRLGADINAQDKNGDSLLHRLVRMQKLATLQDLFVGAGPGGLSELDFAVWNKRGQTALGLAEARCEENKGSVLARKVMQLIRSSEQEWRQTILQSLTEPMIPDLAPLTMGYLDGSGLPFTTVVKADVNK